MKIVSIHVASAADATVCTAMTLVTQHRDPPEESTDAAVNLTDWQGINSHNFVASPPEYNRRCRRDQRAILNCGGNDALPPSPPKFNQCQEGRRS